LYCKYFFLNLIKEQLNELREIKCNTERSRFTVQARWEFL
jgi:hypothetical protein